LTIVPLFFLLEKLTLPRHVCTRSVILIKPKENLLLIFSGSIPTPEYMCYHCINKLHWKEAGVNMKRTNKLMKNKRKLAPVNWEYLTIERQPKERNHRTM